MQGEIAAPVAIAVAKTLPGFAFDLLNRRNNLLRGGPGLTIARVGYNAGAFAAAGSQVIPAAGVQETQRSSHKRNIAAKRCWRSSFKPRTQSSDPDLTPLTRVHEVKVGA